MFQNSCFAKRAIGRRIALPDREVEARRRLRCGLPTETECMAVSRASHHRQAHPLYFELISKSRLKCQIPNSWQIVGFSLLASTVVPENAGTGLPRTREL